MALQTKSKKLGVHTEYNSAVLQNFIALENVSILTTPKLISFGHNGLMVQEKQCVKFTNRVQSTSNVVDIHTNLMVTSHQKTLPTKSTTSQTPRLIRSNWYFFH